MHNITGIKRLSLLLIINVAFFTLFFNSCKNAKGKTEVIKTDVDVSIPQQIIPASSNTFSNTLAGSFFAKYPLLNAIKADWEAFYNARNYSFAWIDTAGISNAAQNLHNRINNLNDYQLNDSLIYRKEFNTLFDNASSITENYFKDSVVIQAEMMLSAQYFMYAKQIYNALGEADLKKLGWFIKPQPVSYNEYLNKVLQDGGNVFDNEPVFEQYGLLKKQLNIYRIIADKGGFQVLDTTVKNIAIGTTSPFVVQLKKRLQQSNDFDTTNNTEVFDEALVKAVKNTRVRHGLRDTALIDKEFITTLNVPIKKRIEQILINMERCKWMPHGVGNDYILVNIPDYRLYVYENNQPALQINVVVGKTANKTVIFNDTLKTIAFSPYWYVPYSIYKKELSGRSASYLRRNNMQYVGNGQIRQNPGGNNALGKVKFLFPNSYNIYFHDTPAKDKFNYTQRAFSHGCIRLSEPKKLAQYLLKNEKQYTEPVIDSLMNQTKETQVKLAKTWPVFITYLTAFVDAKTNTMQFRKDVYNNDAELLKKFMK
jgi:L,D-transpeptidase YcbB